MPSSWFVRVLVVNFALAAATHGLRPIVSYRALALGAGPAELGVIAACFGCLSLVIALPAGRWVDHKGEWPFMVAGTATLVLAAVLLGRAGDLVALGIGMALLGAGQIVAAVGVQTLIANGGAPEGRDARFAAQTVVASVAQFVGPAVAGFLVSAAVRPTGPAAADHAVTVSATDGVFWAGAAIAAIGILAAASLWRWPPARHANRGVARRTPHGNGSLFGSLMEILRTPGLPRALLASLAALSSVDIIIAYLPLYGTYAGLPVETVGLLLAGRALASIASRSLMMPLLRRFGRRRVLVGSVAAPGLALIALPLAGSNLALLSTIMLLAGFGLGLCQPMTLSWVAASAPGQLRGTAIGIRLSSNRLGQFLLPTAIGFIAGAAGVPAIFWSTGLLLAVSAAFVRRGPAEQ